MFQYLIEGAAGPCPADALKTWGLDYAFDSSPARRASIDGPGGQGGLVIGQGESLGYYPEMQVWRPLPAIAGQPKRWVGMPKASSMAGLQSHLSRSVQLPGHQVPLADGQQWLIPAAKRFNSDTQRFERAVGSRLRVDDAGEWRIDDVLPQFTKLWEAACDWLDYRDDGSLTISQAADMCVVAIASNYRVSRVEVGMLGLLDDRSTIASVMNAVIDYPTFVTWAQQKKSTEGSPAAGG